MRACFGALRDCARVIADSPRDEHRVVLIGDSDARRDADSAGLRVDQLSGLRELPSELAPAPSTASERARAVIRGVITESPPCAVLEVPGLLDSPLLSEIAGRLEVVD